MARNFEAALANEVRAYTLLSQRAFLKKKMATEVAIPLVVRVYHVTAISSFQLVPQFKYSQKAWMALLFPSEASSQETVEYRKERSD